MKKGNIITDKEAYNSSDFFGGAQKNALSPPRRGDDNELIEMAAEQFANLFFEYCQFKRSEHYRKNKKKDIYP